MVFAMRARRLALVSWRGFCACPEKAAKRVVINTAAKTWKHTLKPDGDRNIYEDSCTCLTCRYSRTFIQDVGVATGTRTCSPRAISLLEHPRRVRGASASE